MSNQTTSGEQASDAGRPTLRELPSAFLGWLSGGLAGFEDWLKATLDAHLPKFVWYPLFLAFYIVPIVVTVLPITIFSALVYFIIRDLVTNHFLAVGSFGAFVGTWLLFSPGTFRTVLLWIFFIGMLIGVAAEGGGGGGGGGGNGSDRMARYYGWSAWHSG